MYLAITENSEYFYHHAGNKFYQVVRQKSESQYGIIGHLLLNDFYDKYECALTRYWQGLGF